MARAKRACLACYFCGRERAGRWVPIEDGVEGWACDECYKPEED